MFQINSNTNSISPLQAKRFSELGFREREHLQEWLVSYPEALGEELLIIPKEFDGFNRDAWEDMIIWLAEHISKFDQVFSKILP